MSDPILNNSVDTRTPVPPPQFDDEWTVLSARPVVPLEQINAKVRNRRMWFLAGAFAIAMILGAASALVASYLKLRNAATPVVEAEVTAEPVAVAESAPGESAFVEESETEQPPPVESPKPEAAPNRRTVVKRSEDVPEPRDSNASEEDDLNRIRDAVLYDEWQERRARRAERRERRRLEGNDDRDLSNLDEIFEGRRRRRDNPD